MSTIVFIEDDRLIVEPMVRALQGRGYVEAYGGTIIITSAGVDQGTTVSVSWPHRPRE